MNILIYGAGAIGRGFLGTLFRNLNFRVSFVDTNQQIVELMKKRTSYKTAIIRDNKYDIVDVPFFTCFQLGEEKNIDQYDIVFCCVGTNNYKGLADRFKYAKTVVSLENDELSAYKLRKLSGNNNIYFGIPDVITSNTAPADLLKQDELMSVTESGWLVLEKGNYQLPEQFLQVSISELKMHWMCKLFIHNSPHAVLAYLGWLKKYQYIHEAMNDSDIEEIVLGSICEITNGVITTNYVPREYAENYKNKELKRFHDKLLYDPISRVARNPITKLARDNRIILGMRVVLFNKELPTYTAIGAKAALFYDNKSDKEAMSLQNIRKSLGDKETLRRFCGIEIFDPLNSYIVEQDISQFILK